MSLTNDQLHAIREIIRDHHLAFVVNNLGIDAVAPEIVERLKAKGLLNIDVQAVREAYMYGQLAATSDDPSVARMGYDDFKRYIQKNPIPLTDVEKRALTFASQQAGQFAVGLGNKVDQQTGQILIEADAQLAAATRDIIQNETAMNIARRESLKQLKSKLGWAQRDWARDWDRIAITEKQVAFQRGVADGIADEYGSDARVAKIPAPDACPKCKELHLGTDGAPIIFKLSMLERNGLNNYGKKSADWKAVVGAVHPHCQCQLVRVPEGWGFDEQGSMVPGGELGEFQKSLDDYAEMLRTRDEFHKAWAIQGRLNFQGLPIVIENKVGSERNWTDADGNQGATLMRYAYGYIEGTGGADEDELDVYVGPDMRAQNAYVISQQNPSTGTYDEDKVMLGFSSQAAAKYAYQAHYDRDDFFLTITAMSMDHFKRWIHATEMPEEFKKAGRPTERFVIMDKSLSVDQAAQNSPAGNRSPGPGLGVNHFINMARRPGEKVDGLKPTLKEILDNADPDKRRALKRDKKIYEIESPVDVQDMRERFALTDMSPYGTGREVIDVKKNRDLADRVIRENQGVKNKADVGKDGAPAK